MSIQHKKINKRRGIVPNLVPGKNIRDDCATTEGPSCIFPFQFMGEFHHDCMQISKTSSSFMCAIQVNTFGIAIQFGICNKSCPIKTTKLISTNPRTTSTTKTSINTSTDSTTNSTGCTTTNGEVCKFPFIYLGVTYNECTSIDNAGVFWCALSLYGTGEANVYGICGNNCQKTSTTVGKSTIQGCSTTNGEVCKFPFIYLGVTYNECTSIDNDGVFWCALSFYDSEEAYLYDSCGNNCQITSTTLKRNKNQSCTTNGEVCKFPFIYSDVTYNECTSKENAGVLWCATSRYDTGEALDYGACGKSCRSQ
ncbi:uncharacterized protein [Lepeophtheirus salmonis]|uniref:uncharacterized protein isoform X1 n=2 Tax=Lepeophtheirus salmonis TaxID=72036 RepID=UPI001AE346C8|nr:matrix metalloproteinase-9-like isoform X1 [Lepeophtheirus salmonis]